MDEILERTALLRNSSQPMFVRIRELLALRGVEPSTTWLAQFFPDDNSFEFGVVLTEDGLVFQFGYDYLHRDPGTGEFTEFEDWTSTWQISFYSAEIAAARSHLAAT